MKHLFIVVLALWIIGTFSLQAQAANPPTWTSVADTNRVAASKPPFFQVVSNSANEQIWQITTYATNSDRKTTARVHKYNRIATGLNHLKNGQWVESKDKVNILPDGTAAATNGQHQAYYPSDIYQEAVKVVTPDGRHLQSQPIGIAYDDGSNSVMIAELTNSVGALVGDNQVIYANAFSGIKADLLYTYRKDGFEQDVILREQPPMPQSLGLNPATSHLQVLTEFFDVQSPMVTTKNMPSQTGGSVPDQMLRFGSMVMMPGRAFLVGNESSSKSTTVYKRWSIINGRQVLFEEVPMTALTNHVSILPTYSGLGKKDLKNVASNERQLPARHLTKKKSPRRQSIQLAQNTPLPDSGLVLDYNLEIYGFTNFTFQGDSTYYISSAGHNSLPMFGTTTIEGGAVFKFDTTNDIASLSFWGPVKCMTESYRPAIFTVRDDDSVGEPIADSTGIPVTATNYSVALDWQNDDGSFDLHDLQVRYLYSGISDAVITKTMARTNTLSNCEFYSVFSPIIVGGKIEGSRLNVRNVLIQNAETAFVGYDAEVLSAENMTISNVRLLFQQSGSAAALYMTNSLMVCITNWAYVTSNSLNLNFDHCGIIQTPSTNLTDLGWEYEIDYSNINYSDCITNDSSDGVFQASGAGAFYLPTNSPYLGMGTINIDPILLANLRNRTTCSPINYSNEVFSTPMLFTPQVQRDINSNPDLGFHYPLLDYVLNNCVVTNTTLTITNGVSVATYGNKGLQLVDGGQIISIGSPLAPNLFVRGASVQEQPYLSTNQILADASGTAGGLFRFTKFSCPAGSGYDLYHAATAVFGNLDVQDCEFWGGANDLSGAATNTLASLKNNLFWRSSLYASNTSTQAGLFLTNNTFLGGTVTLQQPAGGLWAAFNNNFDSSTITGTLTNGYNAYLNSIGRLNPTNGYDIVLSGTVTYQSGSLGDYYLPTNSPLINAGSTTAELVNLYHFTTQTNQDKEANSTVDIGYHYVAMDSNGFPLDTNADGISDYQADVNGNGMIDADEINWALTITEQPVDQTLVVGANASFSVTTIGLTPDYQWLFNETNLLVDATNATLTITDVTTNDIGSYSVVVSAVGGSITSSPAMLNVSIPPYEVPHGAFTGYTFQADKTYYINSTVTLDGTTTVEGGTVIKFSTNGGLAVLGPLICKTGPYRPALLTSKDDDSAGSRIDDSTGVPSGYYGGSPVSVYDNSNAVHDLRLSYLNYGFSFYTNAVELNDIQVVNCNVPFILNEANITINNALFNNVCETAIRVDSGSVSVNGTQLTVHNCSTFANADQLSLTNSLMVNVTNLLSGGGALTTNATAILTDDSGVFVTAAYGSHYLPDNSPYHNAGTTNVSFATLADIKAKTTYPPIVITDTNITSSFVFGRQVFRDTNASPDLGYHYDAIDYSVAGVNFSGSVVAITPGTVVAIFGTTHDYYYYLTYGLNLGYGTTFISKGVAANWSRIVAWNTVQEQVGTDWITPVDGFITDVSGYSDSSTVINSRFTEWSAMARDGQYIWVSGYSSIYLRDCQFHGGSLYLNYPEHYSGGTSIEVKSDTLLASDPSINNCLFERVNVFYYEADGTSSYFQNDLFFGGVFDYQPTYGDAVVQNNLFDQTVIPDHSAEAGSYLNGYNAFVANCDRLQPTSANDLILTNVLAYQAGPFGNYYQSYDSPLINTGSTNADTLGLFDYTVLTNIISGTEIKETNGIVDIGYHYVAVDTIGNPIATYTNGIPDYLTTSYIDPVPDRWTFCTLQYFGHTNALESDNSLLTDDADGDGISNYQEYLNDTNPTNCYNGILPKLVIVSGNNQTVTSNSFFPIPLTILVTNSASVLFSNAPVILSVDFGTALLAETTNGPLVTNLVVRTDGNGLASVWLYSPTGAIDSVVSVTAVGDIGTAVVYFNEIAAGRLGYWRFNTPDWVGEGGQEPMFSGTLGLIPGWNDNALRINSSDASYLAYQTTEFGQDNINTRQGTLRFWFKPDWSSGTFTNGTGSPSQGRLIELGAPESVVGWWTLIFNPDGTQLSFITTTNGVGLTNLCASINWIANTWHQVVLTYGLTNSMLYLDGAPIVTNGFGMGDYPNAVAFNDGFFIGSDPQGNNQAAGEFDELETYNYQISPTDIASNYNSILLVPPTITLVETNGNCLVTLEEDQADGISSLVSGLIYPTVFSFNVNCDYADSFSAYGVPWVDSKSEGINITKLPPPVISPGAGIMSSSTNVVLALGLENLTNLVAGIYPTELSRAATSDELSIVTGYAQGLRDLGDSDATIRSNLISGPYLRASTEYAARFGGFGDPYVNTNAAVIEYSLNNGTTWSIYTVPLAVTNTTSLLARTKIAGTDDNRSHYAFLTSEINTAHFDFVATNWLAQYFGPDYGTNPDANPAADPDHDGLSNLQEYQTGTNPTNADSDYDGVNDGIEVAHGTDPLNPDEADKTQLGYWKFNDTNIWTGEEGQVPLLTTNISGLPDWSVNAVLMDSINPAVLQYRDEETNGMANINCRQGSIRFWFKPDWNSSNTNSGTGPGNAGRLIELGSYNPAFTNGWWSLYLSADGDQLIFGTSTNGAGMTNLTASISWTSNQWHQVILTYTQTNSLVYVDGLLATNGSGTVYFPGFADRSSGISIGSDGDGLNQARGQFDELETFNYALGTVAIQSNFGALSPYTLGIGSIDYNGFLEGRNPLVSGAVPDTNGIVNLNVYTPLKR